MKPEVSTLRVYSGNDSYNNRSSPTFSCSIHFISDSEFYICNAVGTLDRKMLRYIFKHLYTLGYRLGRYERKKKINTVNLTKLFEKEQI